MTVASQGQRSVLSIIDVYLTNWVTGYGFMGQSSISTAEIKKANFLLIAKDTSASKTPSVSPCLFVLRIDSIEAFTCYFGILNLSWWCFFFSLLGKHWFWGFEGKSLPRGGGWYRSENKRAASNWKQPRTIAWSQSRGILWGPSVHPSSSSWEILALLDLLGPR